jgi:hypothetical protein
MNSQEIIRRLDHVFRGRRVRPSVCISPHDTPAFCIEDDKVSERCRVVIADEEDKQQRYFEVMNEQQQVIYLWAVDGCFLSSTQGRRCDGIIFNETDFCFLEFKLNAHGTSLKTILDNRKEAVAQIKATKRFLDSAFSQNGYDYLTYNLEGYICTPVFYPNKKNTAISDLAVELLEEEGIKLYEQNFKVF